MANSKSSQQIVRQNGQVLSLFLQQPIETGTRFDLSVLTFGYIAIVSLCGILIGYALIPGNSIPVRHGWSAEQFPRSNC